MSKILLHSSNATGNLINCNSAWLEAMGYSREEAVGLHRNDYCTAESLRRLEGFLVPTARAQGEINDVPIEFVTSSGEKLPVICTAMVTFDPDARVNHYDVSSQPVDRELHQEILELRTQLEDARKLITANVRAASDMLTTLKT